MPTILKIVVLNGTLNPNDTESKTSQLVNKLLKAMSQAHFINAEVIKLLDHNIPPGTKDNMGAGDDWPSINQKVASCDILIMATPIWWCNRSSLLQRAIERMDASTNSDGYGEINAVAGTLVQGDEDGGQAVQASLMEVLTYFGFTLPPACGVYNLRQDNLQGDDHLDGWIEKTANSLIKAALKMRG